MAASASDAPPPSGSSRVDGDGRFLRSPPEISEASPVPVDLAIPIDTDGTGDDASSARLSQGISMPPALARIGRYDVLGRLAVGGMAEIYLAQETSSGGGTRLVVLKVLRHHFEDDKELDAMFLREGRVAMQLSHPNICSVYEFGKIAGHYFMAMEYVEGGHRSGDPRGPRQATGSHARDLRGRHLRAHRRRPGLRPPRPGRAPARPRRRASGRDPTQRDGPRRRRREAARLRRRSSGAGGTRIPVRRRQRQVRVPLARADPGQDPRRSLRRLRPRHLPLRDADDEAPLQAPESVRDLQGDPPGPGPLDPEHGRLATRGARRPSFRRPSPRALPTATGPRATCSRPSRSGSPTSGR